MKKIFLGFGVFSLISLVTLTFIFRDTVLQEFFGGEGVSIDKKDTEWLSKYCKKMVTLIPPPPFAYQTKDEAKGMVGPLYIDNVISKDVLKKAETCGIGYKFNEKQAYADMGIEYRFHIDSANKFEATVDKAYTLIMLSPIKKLPFGIILKDKKSAWKKLNDLTDKESGRPHYTYNGFPLIFMRENKKLGLTEYAEVFFGIDYYINLTVFETKK